MIKWEYRVMTFTDRDDVELDPRDLAADLTPFLNMSGAEGWEAVNGWTKGSTTLFLFKRPLT